MKSVITLIILAALAAQPARATTEDVIVVTATRSERALGDVIVPVTVINREQIELASATDIAELLRFEAGLDIGRNGGPGQASSVFLRGSESNHTLVLVDGVRVNPGTIGGAALQNIAPDVIERIEIVKGARSALYGTDAIGGVINVITRRAGSGYAEAGAGGGSFGTWSAYTSAGMSGSAGEFGVTLNVLDSDGYAIRTDSAVESGYDNLSVNLYGSRRFGAATVSLRHWRAEGSNEYLDFFLAPVSQDYRNESSALEVENPVGKRGSSKLLLSHMVDDIVQNDSEDFVTSTRLALDWQYSHAFEHHTVAAGVFATAENADVLSFGSGFDEDTDTRAVFLQDSIEAGRHRAFLAARYTDHETFGSEVTWNVEYAIDLGERFTVGGGAAHAFRAPDATDRYGFGGNVDLEPEVADEQQLHAELRLTPRQTARLEFYRNDIDDLIDFNFQNFMLENIAAAEVRGAELSWHLDGDRFDLRVDALAQRAENAADGSVLPRRAERSLTVNATRDIGEHVIGLSLLATGKREDVVETLPGYVLANLTGQFRIGEHWQLNARIDNLLDTDYQTAVPYRMAGRSGWLELKYRWR